MNIYSTPYLSSYLDQFTILFCIIALYIDTLICFKEKINEEDFGLLFWMLGGKEQFNKVEELFLV